MSATATSRACRSSSIPRRGSTTRCRPRPSPSSPMSWSRRPPAWLLIRRSLGEKPELKYYISDAGEETPLSTLALVACTRCQVEGFLEDCKSYLGMAQYETRSYIGWHHHMTLVGRAHLFVTLARKRLKKKLPS